MQQTFYGLEVIHGLVPEFGGKVAGARVFRFSAELDLSDPNPPPFYHFLALFASTAGGPLGVRA